MDRALWLLLALRIKGWFRRMLRGLHSIKGILLALVGGAFLSCCLLGWFVSLFVQPRQPIDPGRLEQIRQYGSFGLLAMCLITIATSSGEKAGIIFSPAEVDFLFPGPFTRRELLTYKLVVLFLSTFLTAFFFVVGFTAYLRGLVPFGTSYLGAVLAIWFVQLLALALTFVAQTIGVQAYNRARKLVLLILGVLILGAIAYASRGIVGQGPQGMMNEAQESLVGRIVLEPFRWFTLAFTAPRIWPDFVQWGGLSLLINLGLLALVYALDVQYLERSAAASQQLYAQIERMRTGGASAMVLSGPSKKGWRLPNLPYWGGAGPIAWRQLLAIPRSRGMLVGLLIMLPIFAISMIGMFQERSEHGPPLTVIVASQAVVMTLVLTPMFAFDFRGDLDRLDYLKTLPIGPIAMTVGQLVAPVVLLSFLQLLGIGAMVVTANRAALVLAAMVAIPFLVPVNVLVVGLDNLFFLLFPSRLATGLHTDFQQVGRQMLVYLGKFFGLGVATAAASLVGVMTYFLTGRSLAPAVALAWLVLALFAVAVIPLVALVYERYDVARDTPP